MSTKEVHVASWKAKAGREKGRDGYQFGDLTRSLLPKRAKQTQNSGILDLSSDSRSWKCKSGREEGGDGYQFGDFTRNSFIHSHGEA